MQYSLIHNKVLIDVLNVYISMKLTIFLIVEIHAVYSIYILYFITLWSLYIVVESVHGSRKRH